MYRFWQFHDPLKNKRRTEETPYNYVMIVDVVQFVHQRAARFHKITNNNNLMRAIRKCANEYAQLVVIIKNRIIYKLLHYYYYYYYFIKGELKTTHKY